MGKDDSLFELFEIAEAVMRLFFGFQVVSNWMEKEPEGRILKKDQRHLTLLFLGEQKEEKILPLLSKVPLPEFKLAPAGWFDKLLFLPFFRPRVAAGHIQFLEEKQKKQIEAYLQKLAFFLKKESLFFKEGKKFLSHVTLARRPFDKKSWKKSFFKTALYLPVFHFYQSLGHSCYKSLLKKEFLAPFEEIEHTADLAFLIRGENFDQLQKHAELALAFKHPPLLNYLSDEPLGKLSNSPPDRPNVNSRKIPASLDEVILALNDLIYQIDKEEGAPFKAVSLNSKILEKNGLVEWEMIIDV